MNYSDPRVEKLKNMTLSQLYDSVFDSRKKEREEAIRRCAELEEKCRKLQAVVDAARRYLAVKKSWDNRLRELIELKQALASLDNEEKEVKQNV